MESNIRIASFTKLNTVANELELAIYWPNVDVPEAPADKHLRVLVINTEPESTNICSGQARYQWILQVSIFVRDGTGEILPASIADELKEKLPFGTELSSNDLTFRINRTGNVIPPLYNEGWMIIPVQFRLEIIK